MKIYYNTNEVGRIDKRFSDRKLSVGKDKRTRKHKKISHKKIFQEISKTVKLIIVLALITGFVYIQLGGV